MPQTLSSSNGFPQRCPICGHIVQAEPSIPPGDAPCPRCGHLLWSFQRRIADSLGAGDDQVKLETLMADLKADSLDMVELVMELEEEFNVPISHDEFTQCDTIADVIRYLRKMLDDDDSNLGTSG